MDVSFLSSFRVFLSLCLLPLILIAPAPLVCGDLAQAQSVHFGDGFAQAQGEMHLNGSAALSGASLQLTTGGQFEAGSAFYSTPVNVGTFHTEFTFQLLKPTADGMTFTIQNVGPTALGGYGGYLGTGFGESLAIKFDLYDDQGEGPDSTGLFTDGALPTVVPNGCIDCVDVDLRNTGIDLHSGHLMSANLTYDGVVLAMALTDTVTRATWSHTFYLDIGAVLNDPDSAYVGFTAGTGAGTSTQHVTSWIFGEGPPPIPTFPAGITNFGLTANGSTSFGHSPSGSVAVLTDGGQYEAGSLFYSTPVDIRSFTTDFTFGIFEGAVCPTGSCLDIADGMTFTIQNVGSTALGGYGGYLGTGFGKSVAIKFDPFNNQGEGPDSTGLYTNGALPTVPSVNLTGTGIDLHSGHPMLAHITYDGAHLNLTLTDTVTLATWSEAFPINIPAAVGGNTAYVGFTASTGSLTSSQQVTSWTYTSTSLSGPEVYLSWDAPTSSPVPIVGYSVYRSAVGDSGYQLLNSSVDTGTTYVDSTVRTGLTYGYIVESVDPSGVKSAPSSEVFVSIP